MPDCQVCDGRLCDALRCCLRHINVYFCPWCMDGNLLTDCDSCGALIFKECRESKQCAKQDKHRICVDCWLKYDGVCEDCVTPEQ